MATNAPEIIAIVGAFVGCAVLVVTLRVLVRSLILKTFGLDDYIMVGSTVQHPLPPIDFLGHDTICFKEKY
jgi:hypothetical protein